MAAKGKWAQGIQPRHFSWVIQDQLAMCERPGGYGSSHRRVRRQEEIIWIREQGFAPVLSLIPAPHNLHNYDELGVTWIHRPFRSADEYPRFLQDTYSEIARLIAAGSKVLVHYEELGDKVVGFMAGYLVWSDLVEETPKAVYLMEHIANRQIEPLGREIVAVADQLRGAQQVSAMVDEIQLRGLRASGICGVGEFEQQQAQPLEVDLTLGLNLSAACHSDDLVDTVDYGELCRLIEDVMTTQRFQLLERLAQELCDQIGTLVLASFPPEQNGVTASVDITVRKLRPPVSQALETSGVRLKRVLA